MTIAVLPEIHLAKIEVSNNCLYDFVQLCGGHVYDLYLYDLNLHVHCAELTASHECWFLDMVPEKFPEDEAAQQELAEQLVQAKADTDAIGYYHVRSLKSAKLLHAVTAEEWEEFLDEADGDDDEARVRMMEHWLEYYMANSPE